MLYLFLAGQLGIRFNFTVPQCPHFSKGGIIVGEVKGDIVFEALNTIPGREWVMQMRIRLDSAQDTWCWDFWAVSRSWGIYLRCFAEFTSPHPHPNTWVFRINMVFQKLPRDSGNCFIIPLPELPCIFISLNPPPTKPVQVSASCWGFG